MKDIIERLVDAAISTTLLEQRPAPPALLKEAADEIEQLRQEIEQLRQRPTEEQLPEGMEDCIIEFHQCEKGHGRLISTNWLYFDCQKCEIERQEAEIKQLRTALVELAVACHRAKWQFDECKDYNTPFHTLHTIGDKAKAALEEE